MTKMGIFAGAVAVLNLGMWAASGNSVAMMATFTNGSVAALAAVGARRQRRWP